MKSTPTTINHIADFTGQSVKLQGWIHNLRSSGKIAFLQLNDGTGTIQAVASQSDLPASQFQLLQTLTLQSSITLTGVVKADPRSPSGFELGLTSIKLISQAPDDYPIGKKEHGPDFLLNHRHLWLRSPRQQAIQRIRHHITLAINNFYNSHGFTKIDTPIFTPNACEGTTTLFEVDYFGTPAFLSQSGQLYLEAAIAATNRCYDFSPVFRAEKSKTRRHLTEFWMTNAEMAFVDHRANLKIQEALIMAILKQVLTYCHSDLALIDRDPAPLQRIKPPFPIITHQQAIDQLQQLGSDIKPGSDLGNDDETILMNHYQTPLFIEHYPANIKAFYMKRHPDQPELALCADLLAPEGRGEIIGGSQREDDYDTLKESLETHHLSLDDFGWYLDLRKYGSVVHSGFGLGLERVVAWVCNLPHVRETIPFPRLLNRVTP